MASMRTAAVFHFSVVAALAIACVSRPAISSPLLPPDRAVADRPESSQPAASAG